MALINCPECGRKNVSDTAVSCPNCGYGIKAHFEARKREEEDKQAAIKQAEQAAIDAEKEKQLLEKRLNNVKMPSFPLPSAVGWVMVTFIIIFMICAFMDFSYGLSPMGLLYILCCIVFCASLYFYDYKDRLLIYQMSKNDPDAYRRYIIEQENKAKQAQRHTPTLKCPVCGATNIEKVSVLDRATSVWLVGLASGKIGKQYKCRNCGHMW